MASGVSSNSTMRSPCTVTRAITASSNCLRAPSSAPSHARRRSPSHATASAGPASATLGAMFMQGGDVAKNPTRARAYFDRASQAGFDVDGYLVRLGLSRARLLGTLDAYLDALEACDQP